MYESWADVTEFVSLSLYILSLLFCRPSLIQQQHLFSAAPADLQTSTNWADTDEEDDFDFEIKPLPASWVSATHTSSAFRLSQFVDHAKLKFHEAN